LIRKYLPISLRLIAAALLGQTLFFKFSGATESIWIFDQLGAEPWGRLGSGVGELICVILLLIPRMAWLGALGGLGIISGAILAHLFVLGIEVQGDGGLLFLLAVVVFVCCAVTLWLQREKMEAFFRKIKSR